MFQDISIFEVLGVIVGMFFVGRIWLMLETGMTSNERKNLDAWKQKKKKEQARQKKDLLNKLSKEIDSIIENNIKIIAAAYRKSVTINSFGKKNYNKFISELAEFIEDNSKVSKKLKKDYDFDLAISLTDGSVIGFIENEIEELYQNADYTDEIDPFEYEYYCAGEFKKNGWIAEVTQGSSDQGVDVKASKDGIDLVAQCKRFTKPVGNKAVQEVVAGIKHYAANKGIVIAPNGFTKSAEKLAESNNIDLIHHSEIKDL